MQDDKHDHHGDEHHHDETNKCATCGHAHDEKTKKCACGCGM